MYWALWYFMHCVCLGVKNIKTRLKIFSDLTWKMKFIGTIEYIFKKKLHFMGMFQHIYKQWVKPSYLPQSMLGVVQVSQSAYTQ